MLLAAATAISESAASPFFSYVCRDIDIEILSIFWNHSKRKLKWRSQFFHFWDLFIKPQRDSFFFGDFICDYVFQCFRASGPCFFHTSNEILTWFFNITHILGLFQCFWSKKLMTWRCQKRPVWPPSKIDTFSIIKLSQIWHFLVKSDTTPFWTFFLLTSQSKLFWFL